MWRRYCLIQAASVGLRYENLEFETQMDKGRNKILMFICHFVNITHRDISDIHVPSGAWTCKAQNGQTGVIKT